MRDQFMVSIGFITTTALAASDQVVGAWLRLCAYSAPRLLGGRLVGAKNWDAATWSRCTGMRRKIVETLVASGLATWEVDDLVLRGYDLNGELVWQAKSKGGKDGNKIRWSGGDRTPTSDSDSESGSALRSDALRSEESSKEDSFKLSQPSGPKGPGRESLFRKLKTEACAVSFRDPAKQHAERSAWIERIGTLTDDAVIDLVKKSHPRIVWANQFPDQRAGKGPVKEPEERDRPLRPDEVESWIITWKSELKKWSHMSPEWWAGGQYESLAKNLPCHVRAAVLNACPDPRREVAIA